MTKKVDKVKAEKLRISGKSYSEISKELGCSEVWCKKNLKGVVKHKKESDIVTYLTKRAREKSGITTGDIFQKALGLNKSNSTITYKEESELVAQLKRKIKSNNGTIVRPHWMVPDNSIKSLNLVMSAVNMMDERLYDCVVEIIKELGLDETYIKSLSKAITQLTYGGNLNSPINISILLKSLEDTAVELARRHR